MTELRLAGATTIEEANALLKEFLDRFNARFGVPAQHPEAAYRPLGGPGVCLDTALCFRHSRRVARDNTVKYRWRTLQLLPGTERRSYAGAVVDVLEGLDGQLAVRYRGEIIPSQEAPPRPGILRSFNGSFLTRDTPTSRSQRSEQALGGGPGSTRRTDGRRAMLTTRPSTTAPLESARHLPCSAGSPLHSRRQGGTLFRRRSAGSCRFEGSPGNSASIGTRQRSTMEALSPPMKLDRVE